MKTELSVAILLAVWCALAAGQSTIYESQGKEGPVFSDQPSPGAKQIEVEATNLTPGLTPRQQTAPVAPAPLYTSLAITNPADQDTIHSNTGAFDVRIQMTPALRSAVGDRLRIKLDGRLLAPHYSSARISLTAADWSKAARDDNVAHTLQAAVVDKTGATLIESTAITFYAHRATVGERKR